MPMRASRSGWSRNAAAPPAAERVAEPLSEDEFAGLMAALGPFGDAPRLAVAVSGGGDSMALCRLLEIWSRRHSAELHALTVDHGLQRNSATDAARVGTWMAALGIPHHILRWRGEKPSSGIQARARQARYRLMADWAARRGIGQLVLAHQMEDQAETFLLRLERGSGLDGLAAMAPVSRRASLSLLRPLLGVPAARLRATLVGLGQDWLEDPSNLDQRYARNRLRVLLPRLFPGADPAWPIARTAIKLGKLRSRLEQATAEAMNEIAEVYPPGYAILAPGPLIGLPDEILGRVLANLVMRLGQGAYPPRRRSLERACLEIRRTEGALSLTLGGCLFKRRAGGILVCREMRSVPEPLATQAGCHQWDGIFKVLIEPMPGGAPPPVFLARLGRDGWRQLVKEQPDLRGTAIPAPVRPSLAALFDDQGVFCVPHLGYKRKSELDKGLGIKDIALIEELGGLARG